ncbi:predicted protein [Naegleria gruberi]|uniref:Predicted protein n=1 Tax=Naegleria gruberi TaxID=5762 RepID=D2W5D2_NAEGR|nr:uncharacterized protein NAEGRDRAFT_54782 [Naegleria gruberi]EFC35719.1 predicted protein [Naegleria gruberi]|eukprot:XP_002668463.1 predicted protein [Naegleria gruberi strain NEG-M]
MPHDPTRLQHLIKNYYKSDLEKIHKNYERICDRYNLEKKDFLNDVSLYNHCDLLSVSNIYSTIRNESLKIIPVDYVETFKKRKRNQNTTTLGEDSDETEAKSAKTSSDKTCAHCGGSEFIFVCNGNSDGMYLEFPNGRTVSGQTPQLTALTDGDGVSLHVCVGCGMVHGFNSTQLKRDLERYEFALEDMNEADQDELLFEEDDQQQQE